MNADPEEVHSCIKTALCDILNNKDQSVVLPSYITIFIQKVYSYFSLGKTRDNFITEYKRSVDENEPRVRKRKIAMERDEAYDNAQRLGNVLTMRGPTEFENQYIDGATSSTAAEEATTQVSGTSEDVGTQIWTVEPTTCRTLTEKIFDSTI